MTVTTYGQWVADGKPWKPSNPSTALASACTKHGVSYGIIGAVDTHLNVAFPEDHAPYSHTPWPGPQPYPFVLAVDLMTVDPRVARRIMAAKRSGRLPCLKYINWTDEQGACWHTSWQPDEAVTSSTDRGHIHCSFRTDHTTCSHASGFDPFIEGTGTMDENLRVSTNGDKWGLAVTTGSDPAKYLGSDGKEYSTANVLHEKLNTLAAGVAELTKDLTTVLTLLSSISAGNVDYKALAKAVNDDAAARLAQ